MKMKIAVGAALLATAISSLPAMAAGYIGKAENAGVRYSFALQKVVKAQQAYAPAKVARHINATQSESSSIFTVEYGDTLPPVGFVNFCASNTAECQDYSWGEKLKPQKLTLTPDQWKLLYHVNTEANGRIKPISDQALYGQPEFWAYPKTAGDCEDYVLLKKRTLEKAGLAARTLQITVVLDEHGEGHAVLTVATDTGDYVLDNRRDDILLWNDTNYTFLKRQSAWNPRNWVALLSKSRPTSTVATARRR
jgi:predicted transglutaminase-like cysteine proteinase